MRRSQKARSLRTEYSAIKTVALSNCSGGTLGRPIREYIASSSPSMSPSTSSITVRILRIGWSLGIRSSVLNDVSIANCSSGLPRIPAVYRTPRPIASTYHEFFSTLLVS